MGHTITRRIEIDAGHRIASHGSKCRHLHGHRYVIEARVRARGGRLHEEGEQAGMVLDFSFLKEEMLEVIDQPCDHGLIVDVHDTQLLEMFAPAKGDVQAWLLALSSRVRSDGYAVVDVEKLDQRLYLIPHPPTAECLARHWFERLAPAVARRSDGLAELEAVLVRETPNCVAEFSGGGMF